MGADREPLGGGNGHEASRSDAAWGAHVPDYVIALLRDHPGRTPITAGEPTDAVVLVADVAGFTPMSEALARSGHHGIEELGGILNAWFDAMNERIRNYGGGIAEFAGDALIAVFGGGGGTPARRAAGQRAVQCALDMQACMVRFQPVPTRAGTFHLTMKVGLAAGPLLQTVMGDPAVRVGPVLLGPALQRAVAAEHRARGSEVIAADELVEPGTGDGLVERDRRGWLVRGVRRRVGPVPPAAPPSLDDGGSARLAPFLHPAIAERLRSGRRELVNELRTVAALFVGLQAVEVEDRHAVEDLQRFLAAAVRVIAHYGGHFRHLAAGDTGSVLVAFFGAPVGHEDDEERAVRCGLELLGLPGGPYRVGVATGAVYCGEVGTDARREYAVIGDSVNLAARLMGAAREGQLLVDRATYERVRRHTVHERLAPLAVKGKTGRIDVWSVRSVREERALASEPAAGLPLVGREAQVARIEAVVGQVQNGDGHVLVVTGDAGIGKSRLVAEAVRAATRRGFTVVGGASRSHATTTSYLVWRSVWRDLLRLDTSLPVADQRAQLVDRIAQRAPDAAQRAPLLAPVLTLPMPDSPLIAPLDPQTRDGLLRTLLLECLCDVASSTPTLLVLEDHHWIDPPSAALLEFLARSIGDRRVLILVTARATSAGTSPATRLAHSSELHLRDLPRSEAELLVGLHVRRRDPTAADVDPGVLTRIAEQGEGNPFYLEELVTYLHATGVDLRNPRAVAALELPDGLQRLLTARLDQLGEGEKATIKVASVIGRRFRASWIAKAYPGAGGPQEVARHLERLHELDLTPRRSDAPDPEYQFKHAMTQETAYQSLTFRMRESLHERVGLLIESTDPERLAQYVDVLAHHYGRTQRVDKQQVWFRAAGDAARTAFANDTAVGYYRRLLPLLPEAETGEVLIELGGVWQVTGEWAEAERSYRRAMEVATDAGRPAVLAAGERDIGDLFMYNRSHAEAVTWLRRAAAGFDRLGDAAGLSRTLESLAFALYRQGAYSDALATAERRRTLAAAAGDLAGMSIALGITGLVQLETGHPGQARELLQAALDTATRADNRVCLLYAVNNLSVVHLRHGEHRPAVTHGLRAFEVAQEIGYRRNAGVVVGNLGEVYRDEGDHGSATRCFAYALGIALDLRDWTTIGDQVANLAATAAARGRDREAERLFDRAVAIGRHLDTPYLLCGWLHRLATLHVEQGRFDEADRLNQESLAMAEAHDERYLRIRASVLDQRLRVVVGRARADESIAHLRALEGRCTEPSERALVLDALWRLDPTAEDARSAAAHLYRDLYERTPTVEYRAAHAFLTGVTLPPGPPLPPLPAPLDTDAADVAELLRRVDRITPQITGVVDLPSGALDADRVGTREPA